MRISMCSAGYVPDCPTLCGLFPTAVLKLQRVCSWLGWPTGLEPATFGATIRCNSLPSVARWCRTRISKPFWLRGLQHGAGRFALGGVRVV